MSIRECVQCAAATKAGARCKNRTCIYSEFCATHTKALFDLAIKPSGIASASKGLFTTKYIKKGAKIAKYTGDIKTQAAYNANDSGYGIAISNGRILDAASTQSDLGRYANDCRRANRNARECKGNNSRFSVSNKKGESTVWVVATRNILANTEVFIPYGRGYWS
jgi:hypothetical protein